MNQYIVLALGLSIRAQNRITMEEQQAALRPTAGDLEARMIGGKGTYLVTSRHTADRVHDLILNALRAYRPDLSVRGASVVLPALVEAALGELARALISRFGSNFDVENHGIKIGADTWRAGLAVPLCPGNLPPARSLFTEKWKNAKVFGWCPGGVLVAKREAPNVHWGTTVTGPASRVVRDEQDVRLEFSSRSANTLRDLLG